MTRDRPSQGIGTEERFDVAIIGAGPAGSSLAIRLLQLGRRPLIVEKDEHPRFHIGESLTGECVQLLDELGLSAYLETAGFPIKRGVTVVGSNARARFWVPVEGVGADGARFPATTWQVRRDEFDAKLLETARACGAGYVRGRCTDILFEDGRAAAIEVEDDSGTHRITVGAVADCSGQHSFLAQKGLIGPKQRSVYENQTAIFAQLEGMRRDEPPNDGNTHIFYGKRHCWAWSIPLDETRTSVGIVLPKQAFRRHASGLEASFSAALRQVNAELIERTSEARVVSEVRTASNYSYHIDRFVGPGYICVGDSHRFLDPIFSFGVLIALQEAKLAATALDRFLADPAGEHVIEDYAQAVDSAQKVVEYVIRTFWDYPLAFLKLAHFSHRDDIAELFSGRLYTDSVHELEAVGLMRDLVSSPHTATA